MTEELEQILSQLTEPDNAVIQQATAKLKQAFKDPAIIPALCAVMSGSQNPQIRQSAAVMLRLRVKKHWKKISPNDRESLKAVVLQAFMQETEHSVQYSISQLCAVMVKHETPDRWPALLQLLNESTKSSNPEDRQVGLLLLNKVMDSNPEPFKPHYCQLLQLFGTVLQDHENPTALYYCILTLTAITAYTGTDEMNQMRSIIPSLIVALKHLIKADQNQASEAMEVFNELMESEVSIIVPHVTDIVRFFLEVGFEFWFSLPTVIKQKLLNPILQAVFPVLIAAPPPGEQDPEDEEDDTGDGTDNENTKHCAAQIIDTMALHMAPEKLFQQLMPLTQACLVSENPYQRKGAIMCLAVLAEGCADHIRTKMLSSLLQTVCQSLSDSSQVVRSAGLFALGQFSEHLQPEVSKYCAELMPLLLGYLSSLNEAKVGHVTKAFYALENFMENLGADIEPYLPTLMETMLSALNNTDNLKIKELAVSAIGAIANAAKELLVPYFSPVIESLKGFLTTTTEEMRSLQTQSLDTLSVLARTIGKDVFSPLAAECVQLGLNLTDTIDDPDLRRCTYVTQCFRFLSTHLAGLNTNAYIDEKEDACDALGEIAFTLLKLLEVVLPCFVETVRTEPERLVVMGVLESMNGVIKSCEGEVFRNPSRLKEISYVIRDVLKKKMACQDGGGDEAEDEDQQAEYDAMLQEFAGEGIPLVASAVPADSFAPFLNDLLPLIMGKTKSTGTVAERSFSLGTIGEILQALVTAPGGQGLAGRLSNRLLPVLVAGVRDSDPEVRNNSVFGLGCLAQAAGPIVLTDYPMMLSVFSNLLVKESDARVIDNLCGALCRMILSNVEVVPALAARLPLKEDMEENKTVFSCLALLYTHSPSLNTAVLLMKQFAQNHCAEFQAAVRPLPAEQQAKLSAVVTAS
uniref:Importin N-terminal domain-containing protein n=1 Tax=Amphiprion ocellaris TaxID=80972 RepID=A0AAQ5ZK57_AMPOC